MWHLLPHRSRPPLRPPSHATLCTPPPPMPPMPPTKCRARICHRPCTSRGRAMTLNPFTALATSVDDVTPSPLYAPYSGDALTPADPVPNAASAAGLSGAQRVQSRSRAGERRATAHAAVGRWQRRLGSSRGRQPAAAYAAPQTSDGVANGSLLKRVSFSRS
ncbi:hypothetical protein BC834DRAFT_900022, partial [Gloeopeniophorella convolvens]